ncbi:hypothetical protein DXG01_003690 [Tephrocybe rancida]|nr:hypothetical protein DXG01_003690 [Tephrocybe rancida]
MADTLTPDSGRSTYFDALDMDQQQQQQPFTMFSENDGPGAAALRQNRGAPPDITDSDYVVHRPQGSSGWLPAVDFPPENTQSQGFTQNETHAIDNPNRQARNPQRAVSIQSPSPTRRGLNLRSPTPMPHKSLNVRTPSPGQGSSDVRRSASRRSMFTGSTGHPIEGSTFIGGAATTGPHSTAHPHEDLTTRAAAADANLSRRARSKITKSEGKEDICILTPYILKALATAEDGKRLSRIIRDEGRAEKQALGLTINELSMLQKDQANAIHNEAKAHGQRAKLQAEYQKQESLFLAARAKYEAAQARLNSEDEALEIVRNKARDATEKLQDKSQEVDSLRTMFAVDERERAAKLATINGKPQRAGSGCVIA